VKPGLILFAHGARDARWAEPFQRLRDRVAAEAPEMRVALAYLEHLSPDLADAVAELSQQGSRTIRVVPLFFGRGGHLREDFPKIVAAVRAEHPDLKFELTPAAGEDDGVLTALARFALEAPAESG